jgi:hypothetical protein
MIFYVVGLLQAPDLTLFLLIAETTNKEFFLVFKG